MCVCVCVRERVYGLVQFLRSDLRMIDADRVDIESLEKLLQLLL